jgi:hypothetical protein
MASTPRVLRDVDNARLFTAPLKPRQSQENPFTCTQKLMTPRETAEELLGKNRDDGLLAKGYR